MDIRFLSTFLEVAQTRHFGKAADNLYLTQSAVSARIKLLEEYFNTSLFIRNRNSIQLSPAGEKLVPYAQELSSKLADAKKALNQESVQFLCCACTPNAFHASLQQPFAQISASFPDLSLRTELTNIENLSRQLSERTMDLAFTTEPVKLDNIESVILTQVPLKLFCHQDDKGWDNYVHIEWGHKITDQLFQQYPQCKQARLKTSSLQIGLSQLNQAESGFALLPDNQYYPTLKQLPMEIALSVPLYMHSVNNNDAVGLKEVKDYFVEKGQSAG
ncbi:LysR family transcriptional regulator [Aliiglaciecola sp. LCG003]|uniref:LysR family transcriptional regulator n=1 Tax=Aliiglaciecola sp. LCG003 TaxID=3053655 RepID=UPI0025730382|nr:LysR family transcriptional regulator [Aliiglaciecola sp. LCG003]WJG07757.1 LysR family transcriptional regulator [Aliiglaciecola sp. LCG003]